MDTGAIKESRAAAAAQPGLETWESTLCWKRRHQGPEPSSSSLLCVSCATSAFRPSFRASLLLCPICPLYSVTVCLPLNQTSNKTGWDDQIGQPQSRIEPVDVNVWIGSWSSQVGPHWQSHKVQSMPLNFENPSKWGFERTDICQKRSMYLPGEHLQTTHLLSHSTICWIFTNTEPLTSRSLESSEGDKQVSKQVPPRVTAAVRDMCSGPWEPRGQGLQTTFWRVWTLS